MPGCQAGEFNKGTWLLVDKYLKAKIEEKVTQGLGIVRSNLSPQAVTL